MTLAMQDWIGAARAVSIEAVVSRRGLKLKRAGSELVGPCPVCGGRDRFAVNVKKGVFLCRQSGAQGDVIELVEYLDGCDFLTACETLTGQKPPRGEGGGIDRDELARREQARAEAEAAREKLEIDYRETERRRLWRFWQAARPIEPGGVVARYLAGRGLEIPIGAALREHGDMPYFVQDGTRPRQIHAGPAMLGAVVDGSGRFRGLHITWLDPVSAGKATIVDPETGEVQLPRKARGSVGGGHIPLSRPASREGIMIGEGIETTLKVRQALAERYDGGAFDDRTVYWSGISLGNIGGKAKRTIAHPTAKRTDKNGRVSPQRVPSDEPAEDPKALLPPDDIGAVTLLGDGDSDRFTTEMHLKRAARRWAAPERSIVIAWAPEGEDFNSLKPAQAPALTSLNQWIADIVAAAEPANPAADEAESQDGAEVIGVGAQGDETGDVAERETVLEGVEGLDPDDVEEEAGSGDDPPDEPQEWGFDIDRMNAEWAFVLMGSKAVIVREQAAGPIEDRVRVVSIEAFGFKFMNKPTQIYAGGKVKTITWAKRWLSHSKRRSYDGIEFFPNPDGAEATPGYLNLYRGFSVTPRAKRHGYDVLLDHMRTNICHGDEALFQWLFGWFAHLMQRPRERIGTALVFRGRMGAGKTIVGEFMGSLIAAHYFLVGDARYVTGNFNAHMAACLLLQAEEAVWAGDKAAEGRLKDLVTAEIQMIEQKSIDPIRLKNYVRLIMTSNEDWVVPAGKDERRFAVFDVHPRCAQNHDYFREMRVEMENGGREALLADLLAFDLSTVNLRQIPMTAALLEQKFRSLDTVEAWWLDRLMDGSTRRGSDEWRERVPVDALFDDYIAISDKIGIKRKAEKTSFGMKLAKLIPGGLHKERPLMSDDDSAVMRRIWCYALPPLEACRDAFARTVGQEINWPIDGEDAL